MKHLAISLLLIFTSCQTSEKSQCDYIANYYQKIYQADYEFETKNYDKAFEIYQDAFSTCEPINTPTYYELGQFSKLCAILEKNQLALEFIERNLKTGFELKWLQQDSIYTNVLSSKNGLELVKNYENLRNRYLEKVNMELRTEIQDMQSADQLYRNGNYQENIAKQDSIDELNTKRLIEIFEKYGYPTTDLTGHFSIDGRHADIVGMLLHTEDSIRMNYFVPKLTEFVRNGTCSPQTLGSVIDQFYLYNGDLQINGTYRAQDSKYAPMISDLKKVDENRIAIGLPILALKEKKDSLVAIKYGEWK